MEQLLQVGEHILLVHKGHFHVHLGELRLPVGPQVLVPEAAGHLVVFIHAAHHEQLLEDLRALGQGIEGARMHPAGHQVIPGALGGGLAQHGGFHLAEALPVQEALRGGLHPVAEAQRPLQGGPAQVQVAIFQPQLLPHMGVLIQGEGQGLGLGEHGEALRPQLHFAGGQAGVVGLLIPVGDEPLHLHHGLHAQCFRPAEVLRGQAPPVAHHLEHALPVLHVQKNHAAHVPPGLHPAAAHRRLSHVFPAQRAAIMSPPHENRSLLSPGLRKKAALRPCLRDERRRLTRYHPHWMQSLAAASPHWQRAKYS